MNNYYVIGAIVIPYPEFGVLIKNISKEDIAYHVTIGDILLSICPDFTKCHLSYWEENRHGCIANIFIKCLGFCGRWIIIVTSSFKLQHIPIMRSCGYLNLFV